MAYFDRADYHVDWRGFPPSDRPAGLIGSAPVRGRSAMHILHVLHLGDPEVVASMQLVRISGPLM